jgi:membrane associated rhomboid family serine protease
MAPLGRHHPFIVAVCQMWTASRRSLSMQVVYVCAGLFLAVAVVDLLNLSSRRQSIEFLGLSYTGLVRHCRLHQLVTAPLIHGGVSHLLFNMLSLWMLGPSVERVLGLRRYIVLSAVCAAASMLGFLLLSWGTERIVLGYSGVIFGILVAQAVYFPNMVIVLCAFFPMRVKHAVMLFMAVEIYLTISPESGGISNVAHLFGGLAALCYLRAAQLWRVVRNPWANISGRLKQTTTFRPPAAVPPTVSAHQRVPEPPRTRPKRTIWRP